MQHLFIVTYGRTGSTALMRVLNALPGYCIRGENGGPLRDLVEAVELLRNTKLQFGGASGIDDPHYGVGGIKIPAMRKALAKAMVENVMVPPPGTRVTGFKEIRYLAAPDAAPTRPHDHVPPELFQQMLDFLLNAFEDSRVIFLTRAPEAVSRSAWWAKMPDREGLIQLFTDTNERFRESHQARPHRTFLIDHAEFNNNPEGLRPILDWLGEEMSVEDLAKTAGTRLTHLTAR